MTLTLSAYQVGSDRVIVQWKIENSSPSLVSPIVLHPNFNRVVGWCEGACKLSVPRRPPNVDDSKARAYCACSRYGWGLFGHFFSLVYKKAEYNIVDWKFSLSTGNSVDHKLVEAPPSNFIAGRPKAALLFWFFGGFRCGVPLFIVMLVVY